MTEERKSEEQQIDLQGAKSYFSKYRDRPFRVHQEEAIRFLVESEKRFVFLEAPTGAGKSLIAMTSGLAMGGATYMVHTKILQDQITQDFPEAYSLFGRGNYPCIKPIRPGATCDDCWHGQRGMCGRKQKRND